MDDIKRPYGSGVERITLSLAPGQLDKLDALGREWGLSRSEMTRIAIVKLLRDPLIFFPSPLTDAKQSANQDEEPAA